MKHIYIKQGTEIHSAIVDDEDYERLKHHRWHYNSGYAKRHEAGRTICLHHDVLTKEAGLETDHINRNRLDNRKANLRNITRRGNAQNLSSNTSSIPGINRDHFGWQSRIYHLGKRIYLGTFDSIELASQARQAYITKHNLA